MKRESNPPPPVGPDKRPKPSTGPPPYPYRVSYAPYCGSCGQLIRTPEENRREIERTLKQVSVGEGVDLKPGPGANQNKEIGNG